MSSPDQWLENAIIFGVYPGGGGGGGGVTPRQVQEFAFNYEPATGEDDAFIVNLTPPVTVLTDGLIVSMSTGSLQNLTDSPTLQVNALAPKPIVLWAGPVSAGDIEPNASYLFIYNEASNTFQLINPSLTTANTFLVQGNSYNNAIDFGAVNAYEVSLLIDPVSSFGVGFPIYMQVAPGNDNTGASTLTVNGVTDDIVLNNGSALSPGMLVGGQLAFLVYNGGNWVLMNPETTGQTGFVWNTVVGTSQACSVNNGYIANNAGQTTFTAPATAAVGDRIAIKGVGAAGWIMTANSGQTIQFGNVSTSTAGTMTSAAGSDSFQMTCIVADTTWSVDFAISAGLDLV